MKLYFRKSGSGQPLIILHGLFGISDNWATLAKKWSEHFTVYAVDLRNHGQSPWNDEWNYNVMAEDILELIRDEKLSDVSILGHSMGGKTAMRLALDHPSVISKLIVVDIAPRAYADHNQHVVNTLKKVEPGNLLSRKEAEHILSGEISDTGTIQFLLKNLYWKDLADGKQQLAWRFNLDVIAKYLPVVSEATDSPAPNETKTLFIAGEKSDYILSGEVSQIKNVFPNSEVKFIPGAGHWVHADKPMEVYEMVKNFAL